MSHCRSHVTSLASPCPLVALVALFVTILPAIAWGDGDLRVTPDITIDLPPVVSDIDVIATDGTFSTPVPMLPAGAAIAAYHEDGSSVWLVFETSTEIAPGVLVTPRDIVMISSGQALIFENEIDVGGARIDALAFDDTGALVVSYDAAVALRDPVVSEADVASDEDLVRLSTLTLVFDGSALGVAPGLDLDGAAWDDSGAWLVSFDGSGSVGGVAFADEDVLALRPPGSWSMYLDADESGLHPTWNAADVQAVAVPEATAAISLVAGLCSLVCLDGRRRRRMVRRSGGGTRRGVRVG